MTATESQQEPLDQALVEGLMQTVVSAFNAHDVSRFVATMTEDVVFHHSAAPAPLRGRAEVGAFYGDTVWTAFPDLTLKLLDGPFFHPRAPRVSFNWLAVGTHDGHFTPPGLAPTRKRVEADVREILEISDGQLAKVRIVVDMNDLMRQLGLLPPPGSRGERAIAAMQRLQMKLLRRR
jgi:hypothetical protein